MKNNLVTTGCGSNGSNYCPTAEVLRVTMAAFMQRFGLPLAGLGFLAEAQPGALDIATTPVVCTTDPVPAAAPAFIRERE